MSLHYISEKLTVAVMSLATGTATIQKRLEYAALGCHTIFPDRPDEGFPTPELRQRFADWSKSVTWRERRNAEEGTIQATTSQMTDDEAVRAAEELFEIYNHIEAYYVMANPPEA